MLWSLEQISTSFPIGCRCFCREVFRAFAKWAFQSPLALFSRVLAGPLVAAAARTLRFGRKVFSELWANDERKVVEPKAGATAEPVALREVAGSGA